MIEKYEDKYRNYELLITLNNINIINEFKEINRTNYKFDKIINIYEKMNNKDDEITIIYNINNEEKIKIFGEPFVKNNKDKCKIIYEYEEYNLSEEFNVKNKNKNKLEIKLKGINKVTAMNSMFYECSSLISLTDISKWKTNNVTNMAGLFF